MSLHRLLVLNGILLLLTLTRFASCVPPPSPATTQARFNCPDLPAPLGFDYPRLYPFCISEQADCDCYASPHPTYPLRYHPMCDILENIDRHDLELRAAVRYCYDTCSCYEGPPENWSRWPSGPQATGPRIPITQLHNGYGTTTHSESGSNSDSDQEGQARGRLTGA